MDWNSFLHSPFLRGGLCVLLIAAILLGLWIPGIELKTVQPEDPLTEESIREITVLKVGENVRNLNAIVIPNGGRAEPTEPEETDPNETNPEQNPPEETDPEETDPEETKTEETDPQETESDIPAVDDGGEGQESGSQGGEGGDDMDPDLAVVMTWYKYGTQLAAITCAPSDTVSQTLNVAQLQEQILRYDFSLYGPDAGDMRITSVSVAEGDGLYQEISANGDMRVGTRNYTFRVRALGMIENAQGQKVEQDLTFTFVLKCENNLDLELELSWAKKDGTDQKAVCGADKTVALSVKNYELNEQVFRFTTQLSGSLKDDAQIVSVECTTASGQEPAGADPENGLLILRTAPGADTETYCLTFTVKTPGREVLYRFNIVYQEVLDVQLSFSWLENGIRRQTKLCQSGGSIPLSIKNNQLTAGALTYEMELTGSDSGQGRIFTISYESEASGGGTLNNSGRGSLPMTMPEGYTSNRYTITVKALVKSQWMYFEIIIDYANDVTLQMTFSVTEAGEKVPRSVPCENGKTRPADVIYDDQLTDGRLEYNMSIVGSGSNGVEITSVSCYQSGTGKTLSLGAGDEIELRLNPDGKTGENTFTVKAEDNAGHTYSFKINVPYKHRGANDIKILTNLDSALTIPNETYTNLTVRAWSEDSEGNVIGYIPATGTDTKLIVQLDGEIVSNPTQSGVEWEYSLYPANPVVGDTNTHTITIYAEDAYGNFGEKTLILTGQRWEAGQKTGTAAIYVDMTVLGIGVIGPVSYDVLADEPVSYTVAKAVMGQDTGEPFGAAKETFGWHGEGSGKLDNGFYLQRLYTGFRAEALEGSSWPGSAEEEVLAAIDARFGKGSGLATLWRCLYRNGLNKSSGSGSSFGEFDYTSGSGWMYAIGGSTYYPGQSMSSVYLRDGDVLTLRYTLAYGWDVGGGSAGYGNTVGYCVCAINGSFRISHRMETVENPDGSLSYVCHCCGLVEECAHEHLTCRDMGDGTHILYCEDCKATVGDPEVHTWIHSGETEDQEHTCSECGAGEAHIWKEVEGSNTATCTEPGTRTVQCAVCGMLREEEASAKGHTLDNRWNYTSAEHYQKCSTCGTELNRNSHQYVYNEEWDDYMCSVCGVLHDWDTECRGTLTVTEATCQKIAYHCSGCGYDLIREGTFEEYHSYENGVCRYCGAEDPDYAPEESTDGHEHDYTVTEKSDPTCTEAGYLVYTCNCGDTYTEPLPAAGHTWSGWTVTKEATTEEEGEQTRSCSVCGEVETRTIDKLPEESRMGIWTRLFRGFL